MSILLGDHTGYIEVQSWAGRNWVNFHSSNVNSVFAENNILNASSVCLSDVQFAQLLKYLELATNPANWRDTYSLKFQHQEIVVQNIGDKVSVSLYGTQWIPDSFVVYLVAGKIRQRITVMIGNNLLIKQLKSIG